MQNFLGSINEFQSSSKRNALFSAFKDKESNPEDFDFKFTFWKEALAKLIKSGVLRDTFNSNSSLCFSLNQLEYLFTINNAYPLVFSTLINELLQQRSVQNITDFNYTRTIHAIGYFSLQFYKLAQFASSFWKNDSNLVKKEDLFVHLDILKEFSNSLYLKLSQNVHSYVDAIFTETFLQQAACDLFPNLTSSDICLIITYLLNDGYIVKEKLENNQFVYCLNLKPSNNSKCSAFLVTSMSDSVVKSIGLLKTSIDALNSRSKELDVLLFESSIKLSQHLANMDKKSGLIELKRKKRIQAFIDKMQFSICKLEEMLFSIDNAHNNNLLYTALKQSLQATRDIMSYSNLESITSLTEELASLQQETRAKEQILNNFSLSDDHEIETEFQKMLSADSVTVELDSLMHRIDNLSISSTAPSTITSAEWNERTEIVL